MANTVIWVISLLSIAGVIARPFKIPEAIWAVGGAILLVICLLITPSKGIMGILKGMDVYLFLTGMMLLAETAREEKLFDWLAAHATNMSKGSSQRLFFLIYLVGIIVTAFLSNDATAVVLTPAVAASARAAKVKNPLPYLFICAFIANAASFILPISNPANLVIYGSHMPALSHWLQQYTLPSAVAVVATYFLLYLTQRNALKQQVAENIFIPTLSNGGRVILWGIVATAVVLLGTSALNIQLGLPAAVTGIITTLIVTIRVKKNPWVIIKGISWSVLPLVAGLFVIVEAINTTGFIQYLTTMLNRNIVHSVSVTAWCSGFIIAFGGNLMNNLPAGLIAADVIQSGHLPELIKRSVLIGVDLGPNLSVTGSLATILWLTALRREGITVSSWSFLKLGAIIMTIALVLTMASIFI